MNTFNRVVLVLLLLLAMVICSLVLIVPLQTLRVVEQQAGALADLLVRVRDWVRLPVGILLALIVDLVGILLIVLEVRRPAAKSIRVAQAEGGEVTLSVASIADQLKAEVGQLPDVMQVKPKVSAKRKGVMVELDAKIAAETGVPVKGERIVETVRHVVEQKMGLRLARAPKVNIEAVRPAAGPRPAPPAPAPAPPPETAAEETAEEETGLSEAMS